jgi:hypothetical protein
LSSRAAPALACHPVRLLARDPAPFATDAVLRH